MGKSVPALIKPELLVWARETAGYTPQTAAQKLAVPPDVYSGWERGNPMTLGKLREAARAFRRPLAAFFLPEPPKNLPPLKDFRRPHGALAEASSPELLADIRMAHSRRAIALDLSAELKHAPPAFDLSATAGEDPETVASRIRAGLAVPPASGRKWISATEALDRWRQAVETLGVLVFQARELSREEARGFSVGEYPMPVIVIAAGETPTGRVFTLMHELAHLALRQGAICDLEDATDLEKYCNHVAGAILVPRDEIESLAAVKEANSATTWSDAALEEIAELFHVSEEVILRRLLLLRRTSQDFYKAKRIEYLERYASLRAKQFGRAKWPVRAVRGLGFLYTGLVLDAYHNEAITLADVTNYLDVKLKWIPEIERAVGASSNA